LNDETDELRTEVTELRLLSTKQKKTITKHEVKITDLTTKTDGQTDEINKLLGNISYISECNSQYELRLADLDKLVREIWAKPCTAC
jgi:hypothetical protein